MDSKSSVSVALFLSLNLLFFSMVTANCGHCSNLVNPKPTPTPTPTGPTPTPTPTPTPSSKGKCPRDTLKLGVCANLLGLVNVVVGSPPSLPCCTLIQGLADLEAAVCLCTAIKANLLGINLNVPISLSFLLNTCGKKAPSGFKCA